MLEVVVDGDDVRMAERAGDPGLGDEAARPRGVSRVERRELLERHAPTEVRLLGQIDDGHPAPSEDALNLEASDPARTCFHALAVCPSGRTAATLKWV
jgi:hypothetical protein